MKVCTFLVKPPSLQIIQVAVAINNADDNEIQQLYDDITHTLSDIKLIKRK